MGGSVPPSAALASIPHPRRNHAPRHAIPDNHECGKRPVSPLPASMMSPYHVTHRGPRCPYPSTSLPPSLSLSFPDSTSVLDHASKRQSTQHLSPRSLPAPTRLAFWVLLVVACFFYRPAYAVRIPFENCLPNSYRFNDPAPLQWEPLYADARFDTDTEEHNLQVVVWGNVSGSHFEVPLPPPNDPHWQDDDEGDGKIIRIPPGDDPRVTTLVTRVNMLTYRPFRSHDDFCQGKLVNASCPLGPIFDDTDLSIPYDLPSVNLSHDFFSSYAFTSFSATFLIIYGDSRATHIGCASSTITPDLGQLAGLISWLPLVILILVGVATASAGIFSPWGTTDIFRWTSNFGRDEDLLRLVTPGFGDCLQYIQFVALTGSLTLNYPGFYQPIVSQVGWSALMFNESFVSSEPGWQAVQDGIYITNGTHGLQKYAQLIGIPDVEDIWVGMMVWLLVIIAALLVLIQLGFFLRWVYHHISSTAKEDLRAKNLPFTVGNVIRVVFNYFLLPIVALSTFQLVVAGESAGFAVGLAAVTLIILIGFAIWLLYLIISTKPRAVLFDDLPTVLLYGPLYNTYSDEAAAFALIPVLLSLIRGIAIGAVQPIGIAQIILLAICEVIQISTLHAFRPFQSPTSMNAYHTLFSALRFITVMLMVAFIPQLGVTEGPRGWIGYTILILHAAVLVLGFLLNALQTIVEVAARHLGAGGEDGLARGGLAKIFGMRQLQRRMSRRNGPSRQSQLSSTAMLDADEVSKSGYAMPSGRVRSESAGSGFLLRSQQRNSSIRDSLDAYSALPRNAENGSNFTPTTPGEASTFSFLPSPGAATRPPAALSMDAVGPYYRPPRRRGDTFSSSGVSDHRRQGSVADSKRVSQVPGFAGDGTEADGQPLDRSATPAPIPINLMPRADYSTREVDFYYGGVRGPALNSEGPGRKLGTGPADPTGPMASAAGWLRNMLSGKSKDKGKGFEVVRSAKMAPPIRGPGGEFRDEAGPEGIPVAMGVLRNGPIDSDEDSDRTKQGHRPQGEDLLTGSGDGAGFASGEGQGGRASEMPPTLPAISRGSSLRMPSRDPSRSSRHPSHKSKQKRFQVNPEFDLPDIPRKSSKRHSGFMPAHSPQPSFDLAALTAEQQHLSPVSSVSQTAESLRQVSPVNSLPFARSGSRQQHSTRSSSIDATDALSQIDLHGHSPEDRPTSFGFVPQHRTSRVDPDRDGEHLHGKSAEVVDERNMI